MNYNLKDTMLETLKNPNPPVSSLSKENMYCYENCSNCYRSFIKPSFCSADYFLPRKK